MAVYKYDDLDAYILLQLSRDPNISYRTIAKAYGISVGTIHVRLDKMRSAGVIEKAKIQIVSEKLGYEIMCFIGITLNSAHSYRGVINRLREINEVTEAYYTTGRYSIFIKVIVDSISSLHRILTEKIQSIEEIQSTDTIISMDRPINRQINLYEGNLDISHLKDSKED
ncbi:Lrp/AsnC ligand binding domain-containing protein [Psittacicella gerlachiana]|uniref:HTH asnC-type domain-containing protein n=1 Tax=Psittacicella gerlachiana TaxID=2028574 RepID=A0A3A1YC46_9GAMM|nr:Lrp/AsnC ligand binding domain-containing protein [Psittacicella gerlachiana]RIY35121.1 hypothetical protein CKF59_04040 [Psittacicella gerlachiana]